MEAQKPRSLLLALNGAEVIVVLDALVAFAYAEEQEGDPCGVVPIADYVANRVRAIDGLCAEHLELMKVAGLGKFKNRPQG